MALSTANYKGTRDFYPEDKLVQNYIFEIFKKTSESFGYKQYDAPLIESLELYKAKSGQEIVNEQTYSFVDRGGRDVVIRPEMTPSVSRMVAKKRHLLNYPLRLYSIPNLWRYERSQRGRYREHWQLNVDIFGESGIEAELELLQIVDKLFKNFGANESMYEIHITSRKLVDFLTNNLLGLNSDDSIALVKLLDKKDKLSVEEFNDNLKQIKGIKNYEKIEEYLNLDLINPSSDFAEHASINELRSLISELNELGVNNIKFDPGIMRGFDYYTDIVFEVKDTDMENNRSMMGGGRYDGLVGLFGVDNLPVVGFGLGDVTMENFLISHNLMPQLNFQTQLAVLSLTNNKVNVIKFINSIRNLGINVTSELSDKKVQAKIKWAEKEGVRFIVVVGDNELGNGHFNLKDLETGNETAFESIEQLRRLI